MEFQRQKILEKVIENGWKVFELEKVELDWWASEMWELESNWSPVGTKAFITFLIDPMDMDSVWAISASRKKPAERNDRCEFLLSIKAWKKNLPQFIESLSRIRGQ
ncbi:MAG: hypothetical protein R2681_09395 [Pyrinomonadaceae bacterium]